MTRPNQPSMTEERLDRLVRQLLAERGDDIAAAALPAVAMAERIAPRVRPTPFGGRRLLLLAAAALLVALAAGAVAVGSGLLRTVLLSDPVPTLLPAPRLLPLPFGPAATGSFAYADDSRGIVVANADGSAGRVVWTEAGRVRNAEWSRDGTRIAFIHEEPARETPLGPLSPGSQLVVIRPDGTEVWRTELEPVVVSFDDGGGISETFHASSGVPLWAPDGSAIALGATGADDRPNAIRRIRIFPLDGTPPLELADGSYGAAWSPDGTELAYVETDGGGVHVVRRDGSSDVRVWAGNPGYVQWSTDGSQLVIPAVTPMIATRETTGWDVRPLPIAKALGAVAWSNDGRRLALWARDSISDQIELTLMSPDGSDPRLVGTYEGMDFPPFSPALICWSPDDRWIGIPSVLDGSPVMLIVDVESGAELRTLPYQGDFPTQWRCDPWQRLAL